MTARLGVQIEFVQKQLSNRMPSVAMRSMLGVLFILGRGGDASVLV